MKKARLIILVIILNPVWGYSRMYLLQKKKYVLDQKQYLEKISLIEKSEQFSDLPQELEFIVTGESPRYVLTEEKDFVTGKMNKKWEKISDLKIGELVTGEPFEADKIPSNHNSYGSEKVQVYALGIKLVETGRENIYDSKIVVLLKNTNNHYVTLKDISANRNRDRVKPKNIKGGGLPIAGGYIEMFSVKKIREDWKKGYNLFDKWLDKVILIRKKERYLFVEKTKKEEARQRSVRDSIRQVELEEEARQRSIRNRIRQVELEEARMQRKRDIIKKYGKTNGTLILEGKVKIGFTKEMCIEAWGNPEDVN